MLVQLDLNALGDGAARPRFDAFGVAASAVAAEVNVAEALEGGRIEGQQQGVANLLKA